MYPLLAIQRHNNETINAEYEQILNKIVLRLEIWAKFVISSKKTQKYC